MLLSFPRPDYHQVAYFAPKGSDATLRAEGVVAFRERVARLRPDFADRVDTIGSMDDVHVLDVRMDRLRRWWRPGLLCIGDAAHAMSPAGGVGINLAVQDAVATAAILVPSLRRGLGGAGLDGALAAVQRRRRPPAVVVQSAQAVLHRVVFERAFAGRLQDGPPLLPVLLARYVPPSRGLYARGIAFGPLPEHASSWARR
ncbi:FAD-dependent monooxygenase [Curtobacterium sp. 24E2]